MRKIYDYYYNDHQIFRIGYARYLSANTPLELHKHENMTEFVFMKRGTQKYRIANRDYTVHQGEVFFTLPNELHDTGSSPEERSVLFYLIINLEHLNEIGIFSKKEEYNGLDKFLKGNTERIFSASYGLTDALNRLIKCFDVCDLHYDTRIRNALSHVLILLSTSHSVEKSNSLKSVDRSLNYIHGHLNESIRVSELPALEHTSLSTYNKNFIQIMGMPPGEYILKIKIEKAKDLLVNTEMSITDIAYQYGFSSSQYFSTVFKRFCHMTPREFRCTMKNKML